MTTQCFPRLIDKCQICIVKLNLSLGKRISTSLSTALHFDYSAVQPWWSLLEWMLKVSNSKTGQILQCDCTLKASIGLISDFHFYIKKSFSAIKSRVGYKGRFKIKQNSGRCKNCPSLLFFYIKVWYLNNILPYFSWTLLENIAEVIHWVIHITAK